MKWRDVNDKKPGNDNDVLVWDEAGGIRMGFYSKIGDMWVAGKAEPTHWQPQPAPPVAEED